MPTSPWPPSFPMNRDDGMGEADARTMRIPPAPTKRVIDVSRVMGRLLVIAVAVSAMWGEEWPAETGSSNPKPKPDTTTNPNPGNRDAGGPQDGIAPSHAITVHLKDGEKNVIIHFPSPVAMVGTPPAEQVKLDDGLTLTIFPGAIGKTYRLSVDEGLPYRIRVEKSDKSANSLSIKPFKHYVIAGKSGDEAAKSIGVEQAIAKDKEKETFTVPSVLSPLADFTRRAKEAVKFSREAPGSARYLAIQKDVSELATTAARSMTPANVHLNEKAETEAPSLSLASILFETQKMILRKAKRSVAYALMLWVSDQVGADEAGELFPSTWSQLKIMESSASLNDLQNLRDAVRIDFENLPASLVGFSRKRHDAIEGRLSVGAFNWLVDCEHLVLISSAVVKGNDPIEALGWLAKMELFTKAESASADTWKPIDPNTTVNRSLVLIGMLSSIYSKLERVPKSEWTDGVQIKVFKSLSDARFSASLFEAIAALIKKYDLVESERLNDFLAGASALFLQVNERLKTIREEVDELRKEKDPVKIERSAVNILVSIRDMVHNAAAIYSLTIDIPATAERNKAAEIVRNVDLATNQLMAVMQIGFEGYRSIVRKDYRALVSAALRFAVDFDLFTDLQAHLKPAAKDCCKDGDGAAAKEAPRRSNSRTLTNLFKWVNLASSLVAADDTESFIAALENAEPINGYQAKRTNTFYIGANAYVGAGVGRERISDDRSVDGSYAGIAFPVGFEFGFGLRNEIVSSIGVLGNIIDFGSLTTTRLDSKAENGKIEWEQVFSPGVYLVAGISTRFPISIGVGAQRVPEVNRMVNGSTGNHSVWHYGAFIGIDVPLITSTW